MGGKSNRSHVRAGRLNRKLSGEMLERLQAGFYEVFSSSDRRQA